MTIWKPDLSHHTGPLYLAIADAMAAGIEGGELKAGDRLPPQRILAFDLGLTVGTVTRAYAEAERRGLVTGEVGRGTYVRSTDTKRTQPLFSIRHGETTELLDLSLNYPVEGNRGLLFAQATAAIARDPAVASLLNYQPAAGHPRHRAAATELAVRVGMPRDPERIVVCSGAQHGITVVFGSLCRPGDVVLAEELTYPGIIAVARLLNLRLRGVAIDGEGLRPDAFEAACRKGDAKALYCVPTYQNPTSAVMSESRRAEIANIARKYSVVVVEDDVYGFLHDNHPKPLSAFLPESAFFVSSASKSMMPALRIGFVMTPPSMTETIAETVRTTSWMASPIAAEVMTRWIEDGTAADLVRQHRAESRARLAIAERILAGYSFQSAPGTFHIWMPLPAPWSADDFVGRAATRNVRLIPAKPFAVTGMVPQSLRLCLGSPRTREELETALGVVAKLLASGPTAARFAVV
ncbi:MAG: PLP-dependent aminotransferase family protein [Rhodospirillales bacterium]|nr:PLP-dependent aminotransferase family protein [Rhodospirillales bacterium]